MKRILIPTDFSIASLNVFKKALEQLEPEAYHFHFVVGQESSNSISDLLFYSKEKELKALISNDFIDAIQLIQNHYSTKIASITYDILHSQSKRYVKNYIEGNHISLLILPDNHTPMKQGKRSIDLVTVLSKMELETMTVDRDRVENDKATNKISDLFFHNA